MSGKLSVKEVFSTLQGEGSQAGRPAVFVRFSGCNLWSGLEKDRERGTGGCALWCDTQFAGGQMREPQEVADEVLSLTRDWSKPFVVISGGEPCLQLRKPQGEQFVALLLASGCDVAVETNGTVAADMLADPLVHVTVSPKMLAVDVAAERAGSRRLAEVTLDHVLVRRGTDLKVVIPQWDVLAMQAMDEWEFTHKFVQPLDDGSKDLHPNVRWFAERLGWRVSVQTHKLLGLP